MGRRQRSCCQCYRLIARKWSYRQEVRGSEPKLWPPHPHKEDLAIVLSFSMPMNKVAFCRQGLNQSVLHQVEIFANDDLGGLLTLR